MKKSWFPHWRPYQTQQPQSGNSISQPVATYEYLPAGQSFVLGLQHVFAMFGSTVLAPLLMGFDPNLAILLSGISTLLFFLLTGGRVPSYLGSSFAFIGVVIAATGYAGSGLNPNLAIAMSGIIVCGLLYMLIGFIVIFTGTNWIEKMMPPVVTGAIVMIIGLNLAPGTVYAVSKSSFDMMMALFTIVAIGMIAVFTSGLIQRLLLLIGLIASFIIYAILANGFGYGVPIDFNKISNAAWFGLPTFHQAVFDPKSILFIAPVALILVAENLGHIKAVSAMTGENLTPYLGRAFVADGICTSLSGSVGGPGMTTYAENIGVMAVTKIYSTLIFVVAALIAIGLGLSPKFGAIISIIPVPILTGASIVVFGLITVAGAKIWISNQVDFNNNKNLLIAAVTLILGTGNFSFHLGSFDLGGIGTATFAAILLNAFFNLKKPAVN